MPLMLVDGSAYDRGRQQVRAAMAGQVRAATVGRVETARADGLFDAAAIAYLARQRAFHLHHDPNGMDELRGIADSFDLSFEDLFCHLHLGTLRDLKGGAVLVDGCSAWAVADGEDGPLVVKNRDFSGLHLGIQALVRHQGADIVTGGMICLGSLGSPGAYSSGINARGLALADTQVAVATHRIGWLRYFLMTRLLANCGTVAEALAMIHAAPHAGGGTLVMADAGGDIAAVELGAAQTIAAQAPHVIWRTNHFTSPALATDTLRPRGDVIADTSQDRFAYLGRVLPKARWGRKAAARLMATHPGDADGAAPLCQHDSQNGAQTISAIVYSCKVTQADFCEGNPCAGRWQTVGMTL